MRQKLGDTAAAPQYIRTVRGVGYRFIARAD
ncbi:MAG: helix-turn-helix domain-containing protein [Ruthenibacterium sp.]